MNSFEYNEGKCVGYYVTNPTHTLMCTERTLRKHVVLEGEDAFEFTSTPGYFIVDLPETGVYVIRSSTASFRRGLEQVLRSAGYNPAEYIRDF